MTEYEPLLPGIGFSGYRSFATWQQFHFPTKVTVLAGINNSGKSNILRFLHEVLPQLQSGPRPHQSSPGVPRLADLDRPQGFGVTLTVEVGIPIARGQFGLLQDLVAQHGQASPVSLASSQERLMSLFPDDGDHYWSRFELIDTQFLPTRLRVEHALKTWPNWGSIFEDVLINALGGGAVQPEDVMRRVMSSIGGFESLPKVVTIMSARRVEPSSEEPSTSSLSGRGLIDELAAIQNPAYDKWTESRPRWAAINDFVRTILGDSNASLSIPHDRATIQMETPDRVLPLSSLGSGVEQVIVLAAAATVTVKSLVCVEEPETNLHPLLQKKLIRYLSENTDNQYVVATHSSHLLDYARATAYHVRLTTHGSSARLARRPHELIDICNDLGYRPSDLLQANCVIWVEWSIRSNPSAPMARTLRFGSIRGN